jgi:hypothetical protein
MKNQLSKAFQVAGDAISLWWDGRSTRVRFGVITAGIAVVALSVLAILGWSNPALTGAAGGNQISATLPTAYPSVSVAPTPGVSNKIDASTGLKVNFTIDSDGMVVMPVTTNPREAAAAAAAIMYSVDMTKVKDVFDYREKAIARMAIPSPEYVGPGSQVQLYSGRPAGYGIEGQYLSAYEAMMAVSEYYAPESGKQRSNSFATGDDWVLSFPKIYSGMATVGTRWVAQPVQVMNFDEMRVLNGGQGLFAFSEFRPYEYDFTYDFTPDEPGATFDEYWVQLSVDKYSQAGDVVTEVADIGVLIWCDAPVKGGLCGVGGYDPMSWVLSWPRLR